MASLATVAGYLGQDCFNTLYIDGEFVATDGGTFDTVTPCTPPHPTSWATCCSPSA